LGVDDNPYHPPEAPLVDRPVAGRRPLLVFLAGASCIGVSVLFLLLAAAGSVMFVRLASEGDLHLLLENRRYQWDSLLTILFGLCGVPLFLAGRSFLIRRGQRGRRWLLGFGVCFLILVSFVVVTELQIW